MSWKSNMQLRDLASDQRLEMQCRKCGHVHYLTVSIENDIRGRGMLYLDEIERMTQCKARSCRGQVRLTLVRPSETSGFVGGLA